MKIASKTRLSLRKLFTAMLAVGPLAVLPGPVWAVLPTYNQTTNTGSYTVTNGSAPLTVTGANSVSIGFTDKTILSWGVTTNAVGRGAPDIIDGTTLTNFIIDTGQSWTFNGIGSVLNKVVAGTNATNGNLGGAAAAAIINGTLQAQAPVGSTSKVYVLANGGIIIGNTGVLNTQNLVLSTLGGENDGTFIALGDLLYNGQPTTGGNITIGTAPVTGNLTAHAAAISTAGSAVSGDMILRSYTPTAGLFNGGINLSGAATTAVGGNLMVTTNNSAITQTNAVTVGSAVGTQTATFNSGTGSITLGDPAVAASNNNDFERVVVNTSGSVMLRDANIVTLGASTIGGDLTVKVGGRTSTTGIGTDGAVVVTGNAFLESSASSNSSITIANGSSIGGTVSAITAGGAVSLTTAGNLNVGNIYNTGNAGILAVPGTPTLAGTAVATIPVGTGGSGYVAAPTVTLSAPNTLGGIQATATATMVGGAITGYTVTTAGSGYTAAPTVTLSNGISEATTMTGAFGVAGTPYTPITATGVTGGGLLTGVTLTIPPVAPPIYTANVTLTVSAPTAAAVAPIPAAGTFVAAPATITNIGSGYGATPTATVVGGGGTGAVATVTMTGDAVTGISINGGSGYTSTPTIVIADPSVGAVAATARAVRDTTTGLITTVEILTPGSGYGATVPTVTLPAKNLANNFGTGAVTANTTGNLSVTGAAALSGFTGINTNQALTLRGSSVTTSAQATGGAGNVVTTLQSNSGDITIGSVITANRVTVNATGNIMLGAGGNLSTSGRASTATVSDTNTFTATGNITLDTVALGIAANQPLAITAPSASIRSNNNITLATANVSGNLSIRAGSLTTTGGNRNIVLGRGDGSDATTILVGGVLQLYSDGSGTITDNNDSRIEVFGGLNLATGLNNLPLGTLVAAGGGAITLDAATFPGALTPSVRFGLVNANTGSSSTAGATLGLPIGGAITLAENTTMNLGTIVGSSLIASSATGGIIDTGLLTLGAGGATFTVTGNNNVVLDNSGSVVPVISVTGGLDNSFTGLGNATNVNFATTVKLEATTNATGNTTITTNNGFGVVLGNVVTTGNVTVNSGSFIDVLGNANITGNLTLTATGNVPSPASLTAPYGTLSATINTTTGRVTGIGASNLPVLSYATPPTITVLGGSIAPAVPATGTAVISAGAGNVTSITLGATGAAYAVAPTVTLGAPNLTAGVQATAVAAINTTTGVVTGYTIVNGGSGYTAAPTVTLVGGSNPTTIATVTANLGSTGAITGFNVTNSALSGGSFPYVSGNPQLVTITGPTTTAISQTSGSLKVGGNTNINLSGTAGNALLYRNNDFNNVVLGGNSTSGGVSLNDVNNIVVSGTSAGNLSIVSGTNGVTPPANTPFTEANPWAVTLGTLNVASLNVTAGNGGAANSGAITQSANTTIHSFGAATFTTTNNTITIGNNGNNFGRVGLFSGGGNVTFREDGTMKIGNISTGNGTVSLTSRFGGIWEDPNADVVIAGGNGGTINLTSANGSILLGNLDHAAGTTTVSNSFTYSATAGTGAVKLLVTTGNVTLGAIDANSLTVSSGNVLTQSATAPIKVFGTTSFTVGTPANLTTLTAAIGGNITLTNNANNFGRVFVTSQGLPAANIAVTEGSTMNLGRITMVPGASGNINVTSVTGDIIDTGLGGVRPGGTIATPGTGIVFLNALAGNIVLDDPTTDFPSTGGVIFNANNVWLSPLGSSPLYLGGPGNTASALGNLTVTSATGSIYNAGAVNAVGDAFFQSGSGDILMTNAANNFGTVKFAGRIVSITEAGHISLLTGSTATGAATFSTAGGNIEILNRGGTISLASTGLFSSPGNITLPKLIQVSDTLVINAAGTANLSALSVSADLGGKNPVNGGTGTYLPPLP